MGLRSEGLTCCIWKLRKGVWKVRRRHGRRKKVVGMEGGIVGEKREKKWRGKGKRERKGRKIVEIE
jgi:hypothetical protein